MWRWARRTLLRVVPVAVGVVVAVFFLIRLLPGDPAQAILGDNASDQAVAALRAQMGLDEPLASQFGSFIAHLFATGDTGDSLRYGVPSRDLIADRLGVTLALVALAAAFTLLVVVPLAMAAATHRDSALDHAIRVIPTVGFAMPVFWVGILLVMLFAVRLHWLPAGGGAGFASLILPAVAVALSIAPPLIRSLRVQLLDVLEADFIAALRAAGLTRRRVLWRHVLRNAALPTLTLLGLNIAYLVGGTLIVEKVFALNGLGALMFESISNRDFPVVQGVALTCAVLVVLITLATDLAVGALDPRARTA